MGFLCLPPAIGGRHERVDSDVLNLNNFHWQEVEVARNQIATKLAVRALTLDRHVSVVLVIVLAHVSVVDWKQVEHLLAHQGVQVFR